MQIKCDGTFTIKAKEDEGRVPLREAGLDFVSRGLIAGDRFEPTWVHSGGSFRTYDLALTVSERRRANTTQWLAKWS